MDRRGALHLKIFSIEISSSDRWTRSCATMKHLLLRNWLGRPRTQVKRLILSLQSAARLLEIGRRFARTAVIGEQASWSWREKHHLGERETDE